MGWRQSRPLFHNALSRVAKNIRAGPKWQSRVAVTCTSQGTCDVPIAINRPRSNSEC
jgi:hypothetical protein